MNNSYQLFEINQNGELIASKNDLDNSYLEYSSEEDAIKAIEHSDELKGYIILKKIIRDNSILDDLKDGESS